MKNNKVKTYLRLLNRILFELNTSTPTPEREEVLKKKVKRYKSYIEHYQKE